MSSQFRGKTLLASGFHAPEAGAVVCFEDALIGVVAAGVISDMLLPGEAGYAARKEAAQRDGTLESLPDGSYLLPGFVDLHVHAPQFPQLGSALDVPLETWLQRHTFPLESRYQDIAFARRSYGLLVRDLLANGTTTALYFATIHQDATRILVDTCLEVGQRALIGKVAMDNAAECPDFYRDDSADAALRGTSDLIDYIGKHPDNGEDLVKPVITPRFIPACSDAALEGLGAMAKASGCHVQTHCSESDWEHQYVLDRHGMTDTMSLDRFGLLGRRSVLAHGNFISAADMETIKVRQSAIAHCPLSNAYFSDAVFPLRDALERGVTVGLGTDISGGPSASMFDSCRMAVFASRLLEAGVDPDLPRVQRRARSPARVDFRHAFHLATAGGGKALDLKVGIFAPGYAFDAMAVDTRAADGGVRIWEDDSAGEAILQKIVFGATRANIAGVWVGGRGVK